MVGDVLAFDARDDIAGAQPNLLGSAARQDRHHNGPLGLGADGDLPKRIQCLSAQAEHAAVPAAAEGDAHHLLPAIGLPDGNSGSSAS